MSQSQYHVISKRKYNRLTEIHYKGQCLLFKNLRIYQNTQKQVNSTTYILFSLLLINF